MLINAIGDPRPEEIAKAENLLREDSVAIDGLWKAYTATVLTTDETRLAQAFADARARYRSEGIQPTLAALQAGQLKHATRLVDDVLNPLGEPVAANIQALLKLQIDVAREEHASAEAKYATVRAFAIAAMAAGLLFAAAFSAWMVRSLTRQLGAEPAEGDQVCIWVADNGPGLSAEEQAQLFTPFTRLRARRADGHGLGLSIVQRIVQRLGGSVGVESQPGQGSRFFFTLPAAPIKSENSAPHRLLPSP